MDDRVLRAADNNARWCDLVCRSHRVPTATQDGLWVALRRSPYLYPDAVTLAPGLTAGDVLRSVEDGPGCSVKDSFADLDLAPLGFDELFRAHWIFREPAPSPGGGAPSWSIVDADEGLDEWARAAGLSGTLQSDLLRDPSVRILATCGPDGIGAGAVANRTGSLVGVSNVFTTTIAADEAWAEIATALALVFPSLPLVGYERGEHLRAALASGFTELGELRVWLRSSAGPPRGDPRTARS